LNLNSLKSAIYYRSSPKLFAKLFSLRGLIRRSGVSCQYIESRNLYKVTDHSNSRLASTKSRALMYIDGFNWRANSIFKTYLLDHLDFPADAIIVDCGANVGDFYLGLKLNLGKKFRYIGYEPSPTDFYCLENNFGANTSDVSLHQKALWNENKDITFYLHPESASSSIIEPRFFESQTVVSARRLDQEMSFPLFLLKVEAEGAEPEVLEGASGVLRNVNFVVVDVGPERGKLEEETRNQVVELLNEIGFEILIENKGHRKIILFKNTRVV
jgi:FkbM family methyltransferase